MPKLVVATGNPGKLKEMQAYLTDPNLPWELVLKPAEIDVEETGVTFAENAVLKASQVAQATGEWAIADDSGLMVDALGGAPGVYTARYGNTTAEGIQRVLTELGERSDRGAQFVCVIAIARPNGEIALQAEGICRGEITWTPQGEGGFGYDPIFFVPEHGLTFAEMPAEVKHPISHRGLAFATLLPQLSALVIDS